MFFRSLILNLAARPWLERFVRNSPLTRKMVRRFVAGEDLESAVMVAESLVSQGFKTSLDCLGEHVSAEEEADASLREYVSLIERIAKSDKRGGRAPEKMNVSIKLTQLGLLLNKDNCKDRLRQLVKRASETDNFIRIDMEDSKTIDSTLELFCDVWRQFKSVGPVLQAMLLRTPADLDELIRLRARIRLVKGAYLEPESVAMQAKSDVDRVYVELGKKLIVCGHFPAFATHDERIIRELCAFAEEHKIGKGRFEFQMLYGIRRSLQARLLKEGFIVRVYIPYGISWYPYFTRRLAERPANLFFLLRSLFSR